MQYLVQVRMLIYYKLVVKKYMYVAYLGIADLGVYFHSY